MPDTKTSHVYCQKRLHISRNSRNHLATYMLHGKLLRACVQTGSQGVWTSRVERIGRRW